MFAGRDWEAEGSEMSTDSDSRTSRRTIMAAALGSAGALAASAIAGSLPAAAAVGDNLILGRGFHDGFNESPDATQLNGTTNGMTVFAAVRDGSGLAIEGFSTTGTGVLAVSGDNGTGLDARSTNATAAIGSSFTGSGVYGFVGSTVAPPLTGPAAGVVARAVDPSRLALRVMGRASFGFSGKATILANTSTVVITRAGVTAASLIIATPRTNRAGVFVQSAVPAAGKFTIHLNKKVAAATDVAYMILG